jgi:hypothetical protein
MARVTVVKALLATAVAGAALLLTACGPLDELLWGERVETDLDPCIEERLLDEDDEIAERYAAAAHRQLRTARLDLRGERRPLMRETGERGFDDWYSGSLIELYAELLAAEECAREAA